MKINLFNKFSLVFLILVLNNTCNNSPKDLSKYFAFLGNSSGTENPKIYSSIPGNGDKNLPRTQKISILFDRPMNMNSCIQAFSIQPQVRGFFINTDISLEFTPATQLDFGSYTFTLTKFCEDKNGNDIKDIFTVNFSVGDVSNAGSNPSLVSATIFTGSNTVCNSGSGVSTSFLNAEITTACMGNPSKNKISLTFSRAMDKSITQTAIAFSPSFSSSMVWESDTVLNIIPDFSLAYNQRYTMNISTTAQDSQGQKLLSPITASFLVGTSNLIPSVSSIQVSTGSAANCSTGSGILQDILTTNVNTACVGNPTVNPITITFSIPMDTASTQNAFSISPSISGIFSWSSNNTILTYTPSASLQVGLTYTISINKSALSSNQVGMNSSSSGSFITDPNAGNAILNTINISQGSLANCNSGTGTQIDLITNNISNACLGNPNFNQIIWNFNYAMNTSVTQAAISISPTISGSYVWSAGNQTLTFTPNNKLDYGTQYTITISQAASTSTNINLSNPITVSFTAGAIITTPQVQAFGVASQTCPTTAPGIGSNTGGNWLLGSCYWDNSLSVLTPSSYQFRAGDTGTGIAGSTNDCADVLSDNFRVIFNTYMDTNATLNATSFKRLSPPLTTMALASWTWTDCQAVYPFGCRVLTLAYAEQEASCNGNLFGNATTGGDFNLLRSDNTPANYPFYQITISNSAKDVNGLFLNNFIFTMEAK